MRRVVVTGMGIVSSIGNNTQEVLASLYEAKPGITHSEDYAKLGFRSQVFGRPSLNPADVVDRRAMRFLGEGAAWNHVAMEQAIRDSGLEESDIVNPRTGIIMGSAARPRAPSSKLPTPPAQRGPSALVRSPYPRRCRRQRPRHWRPGSRSRASTIRSRRLAPRRTIASAMPMRPFRSASRTLSSPAAVRISTGPCRFGSTPWVRCRRNTTIPRHRIAAPMM